MPTQHRFAALPSPGSRVPNPAIVHLNYGVARKGLPSALSFRRWVDAALAGAKRRPPAELAIRIVGTREGRRLNRNYRDKDYATNVLSFPVELPPGVSLPLIGDLAMCAPVVAREAVEQNKLPNHHWAHLTVHGVLHLLGYDHIEDAEAEAMEALETRILAKLGIDNPYAVERDT
ncbi:rRNA maturation RNase YbeY [Dyella sp. M7H15-1]|uniref:rRNA maturation RNase YbeY n=1 Tax=Dyella sp. M7H15-1 TaxID=2501295 RepID=UPI001004ED8F|nr:rRNA maturation RNase YbeY [Dyella sp. M7H15-1]QAU25151.1 rRNA maturation RNase YbeY [Dyella sp. M7H15-1]